MAWEDYYEMQKPNLLYPNEAYINSKENINKADLVRMTYVFNDFMESATDCSGEQSMLDVGCNDGYFMRHFEWPFDKYIGVDMFSIEEYLHTNEIAPYTKDGRIKYITGLFEEIDLKQRFDFIFAGEIIEHVENVNHFLENVDRHLADDGWVCFTTPNSIGKNQPEHYRQYSKEALEIELKNFFRVVKIDELPAINSSWPFLYAKCRKF